MVTSNTARKSGGQTPVIARQNSLNFSSTLSSSQQVFLDGEENKAIRAFRQLGHGKPCLTGFNNDQLDANHPWEEQSSDACSLHNAKGVMLLGADLLRHNFPRSRNGLPPLVGNLANLMSELSKLSGRDT